MLNLNAEMEEFEDAVDKTLYWETKRILCREVIQNTERLMAWDVSGDYEISCLLKTQMIFGIAVCFEYHMIIDLWELLDIFLNYP